MLVCIDTHASVRILQVVMPPALCTYPFFKPCQHLGCETKIQCDNSTQVRLSKFCVAHRYSSRVGKPKYEYPYDKPCESCGKLFQCFTSTQVAIKRFCELHGRRQAKKKPIYKEQAQNSGYSVAYESMLTETTCVDCEVKCRHPRQWLKRGGVPRCKPCGTLERSRRCRAEADPANTVEVSCVICKHVFTRVMARIRRANPKNPVTCSRHCFSEAAHAGLIKTRNPRTQQPDEFSYGPTWKRQRTLAKQRDNYTCQNCGIHQYQSKRSLHVHHIVRFYDFADASEAHALSNLTTLCPGCHRRADKVQHDAIKAAGRTLGRTKPRPVNQSRVRQYTKFAELVCILARNWKSIPGSSDIDGENSRGIDAAIRAAARLDIKRSRGLDKVGDRCQVKSMVTANAEVEACCWQFTLEGQKLPDTRTWKELLASGDNKHIVTATRTHYYDWDTFDETDCVVIYAGRNGNRRATKREWHV